MLTQATGNGPTQGSSVLRAIVNYIPTGHINSHVYIYSQESFACIVKQPRENTRHRQPESCSTGDNGVLDLPVYHSFACSKDCCPFPHHCKMELTHGVRGGGYCLRRSRHLLKFLSLLEYGFSWEDIKTQLFTANREGTGREGLHSSLVSQSPYWGYHKTWLIQGQLYHPEVSWAAYRQLHPWSLYPGSCVALR